MRSLKTMMQKATNFNTPEPVREQLVKDLVSYPCKEVTMVLAKIAVVDISYTVRRAATLHDLPIIAAVFMLQTNLLKVKSIF